MNLMINRKPKSKIFMSGTMKSQKKESTLKSGIKPPEDFNDKTVLNKFNVQWNLSDDMKYKQVPGGAYN